MIIPESDVCRLVMRSNLRAAEAFQDWGVKEVLPTIRKSGGYVHATSEMSNEEIMAFPWSSAWQILLEKLHTIFDFEFTERRNGTDMGRRPSRVKRGAEKRKETCFAHDF